MIAKPDAKAFEVHDREILKAAQAMLDLIRADIAIRRTNDGKKKLNVY